MRDARALVSRRDGFPAWGPPISFGDRASPAAWMRGHPGSLRPLAAQRREQLITSSADEVFAGGLHDGDHTSSVYPCSSSPTTRPWLKLLRNELQNFEFHGGQILRVLP